MITQDQYNQLVEKIVEAVPEIMELKFGCIIELEGSNPLMIISENQSPFVVLDGQTIFPVEYDSGYKIHGRPIQLADVLRALSEIKVEGRKILYGLAVTTKGDFLFNCVSSPEVGREWLYRFNNKIGHITWDLSLPLDQQSDATKEFFYNLIVK